MNWHNAIMAEFSPKKTVNLRTLHLKGSSVRMCGTHSDGIWGDTEHHYGVLLRTSTAGTADPLYRQIPLITD